MSIVSSSLVLVVTILLSIASLIAPSTTPYDSCSYNVHKNAPEVYWINMDKSKTRRVNMAAHLDAIGFNHFRIRGITYQEIYVPDDIESTWRTAWCKLQTSWIPPNKVEKNYFGSSNHSQFASYSTYTASLCGRGKNKNTPKELGCTSSHLVAMYQAIYSTTATSRYALIIEDDVLFPFDIDFDALTKSAPEGFGILQLFNSNEGTMEQTWKRFLTDPNFIWAKKQAKKYFDYWSTCAYLIDRVVMKPIIDAVVKFENNGWISLKIVAGINSPCVPKECCEAGTDNFILRPPCVWAPRGYQADSFLYAMTSTYVITVPIIANGLGGNQSTFHQDHVELLHRKAFRRQREYVNQLYKTVKPPEFMKPACTELLDVNGI
jgi:GR25 family glycosyltransferase involved in LPS biosynthesis